jgi:hypothetical protein
MRKLPYLVTFIIFVQYENHKREDSSKLLQVKQV